jgi:hypothetical protein
MQVMEQRNMVIGKGTNLPENYLQQLETGDEYREENELVL